MSEAQKRSEVITSSLSLLENEKPNFGQIRGADDGKNKFEKNYTEIYFEYSTQLNILFDNIKIIWHSFYYDWFMYFIGLVRQNKFHLFCLIVYPDCIIHNL